MPCHRDDERSLARLFQLPDFASSCVNMCRPQDRPHPIDLLKFGRVCVQTANVAISSNRSRIFGSCRRYKLALLMSYGCVEPCVLHARGVENRAFYTPGMCRTVVHTPFYTPGVCRTVRSTRQGV